MKEARVNELKECIEQLKRSVDTLTGRMYKEETTYFAEVYNRAIKFAISLYMLDIQVLETKLKLIEDEKI